MCTLCTFLYLQFKFQGSGQISRLFVSSLCLKQTLHLTFVGIFLRMKAVQRLNIKFLIKLEKSATETYSWLNGVYDYVPSVSLDWTQFTKGKEIMDEQVQIEGNEYA